MAMAEEAARREGKSVSQYVTDLVNKAHASETGRMNSKGERTKPQPARQNGSRTRPNRSTLAPASSITQADEALLRLLEREGELDLNDRLRLEAAARWARQPVAIVVMMAVNHCDHLSDWSCGTGLESLGVEEEK